MPTIEIASIDSKPINLKQIDFGVAIIEENKLESHRGLFDELLRKHQGVIIHIGNPDMKIDRTSGYFAGKLIDWEMNPGEIIIPQNASASSSNQEFIFRILSEYCEDIHRLLEIAIEKSPINKVYFLTDYQFGPEKVIVENIYTIGDFWELHNSEGLTFNTLYEIYSK
jgi:hypothetical protein